MTGKNYNANDNIAEFFEQTTVTQSECDARAKELVGGDVKPVDLQGTCSYTVYAGLNQEFVVQFRLRPLLLKQKTITLARHIYGSLVPGTTCHGHMGDMVDEKECVMVYAMDRVQGISQWEFLITQDEVENSPKSFVWRQNLISDMARFFALAWKTPLDVNEETREALHQRYEIELKQLLDALPDRFHPIIRRALDSLSDIMSLPMVLLHNDLGVTNVMVDETSHHMVGVIDWAEAEVGPFGMNLHFLQQTTGSLHRKHGWTKYDDYAALHQTFWETLREAVGLSENQISIVSLAMTVGLLLSHGFTCRLANMPTPRPIQDDVQGAYKLLNLDNILLDSETTVMHQVIF